MQKRPVDAVVISGQLIDRLRREAGKSWANLLALYTFYYHTAVKQKTNCPMAVNLFVSKGLYWGMKQVKARKAELERLGLIKNIKRRGPDGKISGWYVQVNFIWKQSTSIPEIPVEKSATGIFSHPVVSDHQMLKVQKDKCFKSEEKGERGKGKDPTLDMPESIRRKNPESTEEKKKTEASPEISPSNSFPEEVKGKVHPLKTQGKVEQQENQGEGFLSREEYSREMGEAWRKLCGVDGNHVLMADLASNARRGANWAAQKEYWIKRLSDQDESQIEAWRLIAKYLRVYCQTNKAYPDTRRFLDGWRADSWQQEKTRIQAFCKSHNADPAIPAYVESRGEDGREIQAKWLLSSKDYQNWFMRLNREDAAHEGDLWEDQPSAGLASLEDWEDRHAKGLRVELEKREADAREKESLELIARSRPLIRAFQNDDAAKKKIIDLLKRYGDGNATIIDLRLGVETMEAHQQQR